LTTGNCDESDEQKVTMKFSGFVLTMYFEKTPGMKEISIHVNLHGEEVTFDICIKLS
jgi:hypothetical protein